MNKALEWVLLFAIISAIVLVAIGIFLSPEVGMTPFAKWIIESSKRNVYVSGFNGIMFGVIYIILKRG